jgi:hypothetical protein
MSFVREHPLMAGRTFVALIATAILHTPTIVLTTASLGYANASSVITTPASVAYAVPTDEAGMTTLLIATTQ